MNFAQVMNAAIGRHLASMFPGFHHRASTKHDHYKDFGYPENLDFDQLYFMYRRNGIANSAVERTTARTWQGNTFLLEQQRDGSQRKKNAPETTLEKQIRLAFRKLRFWSKLAEADRRAMIGGYSAILLRLGDGENWDQPVTSLPGLDGIKGMDVVWAKQIKVAEWHMDLNDAENYGTPKMFDFQETPLSNDAADKNPAQRSLKIHPDRVFIWSKDGTILAESFLAAGFNDLIDIEKIKGAGGEGFWKNAKAAPVFETDDASTTFAEMAKAMGVGVEDLHKKMNEQVENYQKGFDQMLMLQGMKANTLSVTLPSPEHFYAAPLMSFAASVRMPLKVLIGNQTGERASSEDAKDWDQSIMARRTDETHPLILSLLEKFVAQKVLPVEKDWYIDQADLTEASVADKIDRAGKMADINVKSNNVNGMMTFTGDEIREVADYEPISPTLLETPDEEPEDETNNDTSRPN